MSLGRRVTLFGIVNIRNSQLYTILRNNEGVLLGGLRLYPPILESRFASKRVGKLKPGSVSGPIKVRQDNRVG